MCSVYNFAFNGRVFVNIVDSAPDYKTDPPSEFQFLKQDAESQMVGELEEKEGDFFNFY